MDSLTHIVTGACIGELFAGKKLGKKAMLWGALMQTLPDVDVVTSLWMDIPDGLLAHRGFTHSILFAVISCILFALLAQRWHKSAGVNYTTWLLFFATELATHLFLDTCTAYGTGLMEPFSHARFSLNTIFVADVFFTIIPLIAAIVLLILRKTSNVRLVWARIGIVYCCIYLLYCSYNKFSIEHDTKELLAKRHISYTKHFTTPTPLNNWLWYIVAGDEKGYYTGYRSVFDTKDTIALRYSPRNDSLLRMQYHKEEVQKLIRFSQGYYTVENQNDTIIMNDLRFEQQAGWKDPQSKFVFYYYLQQAGSHDLTLQRGRFEKADGSVFISLIDRIKGN